MSELHPEKNSLFYFGYGSNMSSAVLVKQRDIHPISIQHALLRGFRLVFNEPGVRYVEPSFANIEESKDEQVEGVLYEITKNDMERLVNSESSNYKVITVEIETECGLISANTLQTQKIRSGVLPSRRYMRLLIRGAKEHGLSPNWIRKLEQQSSVNRPIARKLFTLVIPILQRIRAWRRGRLV